MFPVSSPFGWRIDPVTGEWHEHQGIDIPAPMGSRVVAVADGVLTRIDVAGVGKGAVNGNAVFLRHPGGWTTAYLHLGAVAKLPTGAKVPQGSPIGVVGMTGRATGPHLHFALYTPSGLAVDPLPFFVE